MTISFFSRTTVGFTTQEPFSAFTYPAGEPEIKVADFNPDLYDYHVADLRGADSNDIITLAMWADAVGADKKVLILPYLPGARKDRGTPIGAIVYAGLINSLHIDKVITLDPHSFIMPDALDNLTIFPFQRIIKREIQDKTSDSRPQPYVGVIAPDKGAHDRAAAAALVMGVPVYTAGKTRDFATGKLTGFHMEDELPDTGKFLVVDDIIDGGRTFVGLAEAIHSKQPGVELDLWVTHGIFSKGLDTLLEHFLTIHTTDSFPSQITDAVKDALVKSGELKIHSVTPYLYGEISI
jgi:ribose-phosphate pyrophosphokinase